MLAKLIYCFRKIQIIYKQKIIDFKFKKYGLTDEILDSQIRLNKLKNEYDVNESIKEYVQ